MYSCVLPVAYIICYAYIYENRCVLFIPSLWGNRRNPFFYLRRLRLYLLKKYREAESREREQSLSPFPYIVKLREFYYRNDLVQDGCAFVDCHKKLTTSRDIFLVSKPAEAVQNVVALFSSCDSIRYCIRRSARSVFELLQLKRYATDGGCGQSSQISNAVDSSHHCLTSNFYFPTQLPPFILLTHMADRSPVSLPRLPCPSVSKCNFMYNVL